MGFSLRHLTIAAIPVMLTACAPQMSQRSPIFLSPAQAVFNAADRPAGFSGVFEMVVRASGRQRGILFLNSERDYRDQRNLSIAIAPDVARDLQSRLGGPIEEKLLDAVIAVRGTARKTRIHFTENGQPTGKYYFQTHLWLRSARDLTVAGEQPTD